MCSAEAATGCGGCQVIVESQATADVVASIVNVSESEARVNALAAELCQSKHYGLE